jgi:hypothetical protein
MKITSTTFWSPKLVQVHKISLHYLPFELLFLYTYFLSLLFRSYRRRNEIPSGQRRTLPTPPPGWIQMFTVHQRTRAKQTCFCKQLLLNFTDWALPKLPSGVMPLYKHVFIYTPSGDISASRKLCSAIIILIYIVQGSKSWPEYLLFWKIYSGFTQFLQGKFQDYIL